MTVTTFEYKGAENHLADYAIIQTDIWCNFSKPTFEVIIKQLLNLI